MQGAWRASRNSSRCNTRTLWPNQHSEPRKQEVSPGVIDNIYLASIKTGFQRCEGDVQLEDCSLAVACVQFRQLNQRAFIGFGFSLEEGDVGQKANGRLGILLGICASSQIPSVCRIRNCRLRRI